MNIKKLFTFFKKPTLVDYITKLPSSDEDNLVSINRELTETECFTKLLNKFEGVSLLEANVSQNTNITFTTFAPSFQKSAEIIDNIHRSIENGKEAIYRFRSINNNTINTYMYFTMYDANFVYGEVTLKANLESMKAILAFYEKHKTEDDTDQAAVCDFLFPKLNVLFDYYYSLLCVLNGIRIKNPNVAVNKSLDY